MSSNSSSSHIAYGSSAFKAILFSLFLAGFAIFSSLYCVQPMMPILADYFHISPTQSSFPLSFSTIALAIGLIFTGLISDHFGRKPIMVWSLFSVSVLLLLSALLPIWSIFLATRVLIGLTVSGVAAVAMTYIGGSGRARCGLCHGAVYFRNCDWGHERTVDRRDIGRFYFLAICDSDHWVTEPMYRYNLLFSIT